jgi:uncharacterized protein YdeI (YjbR/CyaY-like superfamily)
MSGEFFHLKRERYPMPGYIRQALVQDGMMDEYINRPPYQQNDYIGWITRAKLEPTRQKRLKQMLEELKRGDAYMKMPWRGKQTPAK